MHVAGSFSALFTQSLSGLDVNEESGSSQRSVLFFGGIKASRCGKLEKREVCAAALIFVNMHTSSFPSWWLCTYCAALDSKPLNYSNKHSSCTNPFKWRVCVALVLPCVAVFVRVVSSLCGSFPSSFFCRSRLAVAFSWWDKHLYGLELPLLELPWYGVKLKLT